MVVTDIRFRKVNILPSILEPHVMYCMKDDIRGTMGLHMTDATGTVRWGFEYTVAKGHQQQVFHEPVVVYQEHTITQASQGLHVITEVTSDKAIPSVYVEPDSYIKMRVFRDAGHVNDTIHAWCCDLHYQFDKSGTRNKSPSFYGI